MSAPLAAFVRHARLLAVAVEYELRKVAVFRVGFVVREVLSGAVEPLVMIAVYHAVFAASGAERLGSWSYTELVHYMLGVAVFRKLVFHNRVLDLSDQIFEGYFTKFLVMPVRFVVLPFARWVQFTLVQVVVVVVLWALGALLFPDWWPRAASAQALLQALALALVGSLCFFELYLIVHLLAFWLDVVWSLLVMAHFLTGFAAGAVMPVSMMPGVLRDAFAWTFPYWTVSAPIELFLGRLGTSDFQRGLLVLAASLTALEALRRVVWVRGTRRYRGSGM